MSEVKDSVYFSHAAHTDPVTFPGGDAPGMIGRACGLPGTFAALLGYSEDEMVWMGGGNQQSPAPLTRYFNTPLSSERSGLFGLS